MRYIPLPAVILRPLGAIQRLYWRLAGPATFGVKVLITHPDDPARFLIVRHSYSDTQRWGLPGGGYRPAHETPQAAAVREVAEELRLRLRTPVTVLDTLTTWLEGKHDTLTIVTATAADTEITSSAEIAEARWVNRDDLDSLTADQPQSRWLIAALNCLDLSSLNGRAFEF